MIWFRSIDSTTISWNTAILRILRELFTARIASSLFVRTDQWASAQHEQCMQVRKAIMHYPCLKYHENEWFRYHSFQKFYLMKLKYAIFSNIKVTLFRFFETPGIECFERGCYILPPVLLYSDRLPPRPILLPLYRSSSGDVWDRIRSRVLRRSVQCLGRGKYPGRRLTGWIFMHHDHATILSNKQRIRFNLKCARATSHLPFSIPCSTCTLL